MFKRFVMMTLLVLLPEIAQAQPRIPRVGFLLPEMGRSQSESIKGIRDELKEIGYQEGKSILLDNRNAKGDRAALEPAAAALVDAKADVIFTTGTRATEVAKSATRN